VIDVFEQLVLPALREMHIHIDKTNFGGRWKACRPLTKGILTRIEEETWLLPEQLPTCLERACQVIEQYIQQGHYQIRSHCNVDPSIGTKQIEITKEAFSRYEQYITHEIVA
ncbi:deaminase, partial [Enterococcus faecalis]